MASTPANPSGGGPGIASVVTVTTTVQALATLCSVIPAAIAPELARTLGVPASLIGVQVSLVYMGAMIISAFSGLFVRRWGAVRTSQLALGLSGLGVLLAAVPSLSMIAAGSVLMGCGYGVTNPSSTHLLMRVTQPDTRNLFFSIKQTGVPLGGVAAGLAAPSLALAFGWQGAMIAGAVVAFAFMVAIERLRGAWDDDRDPAATLRQNLKSDLAMIWEHGLLRRMSLAALCFSAVQVSLTTFAVTMLVEEIEFGLVTAGIVFSILQVAGVSGRILWGAAADATRDGNRVLLLIALIASAAGLMMVFLTADSAMAVIYGVMVLFGLSAIGWNGVFLAEVARLAPQDRISNATGIVMVPTFAGVLVGPASFTAIFALTGAYTLTFGLFVIVSLAGFAFVLAARRLEKGQPAGAR